MQDIITLQQQGFAAIDDASSIAALEAIRVDFLGKKGRLTDILKGLVHLSAEDKPKMGQWVNQAKRDLTARIDEKMLQLKEEMLEAKLTHERLDVTLPGRENKTGSLHPVTQVRARVNEYFSRLGFDIVEGPEIETEHLLFWGWSRVAHTHLTRANTDHGDGNPAV